MVDVPWQPSVLREMSPADLDDLLPIQREAAQVAFADVFPQDQFPFPTDAVRRRWEDELADPGVDCFVVVDDDGSPAGFVAVQGPQFLHLGTALGSWGTGLAGKAHAEVVARWRAQGYSTAWLWVFELNPHGRRFYERRGWHPTGERERSDFAPYPVLLRYEIDLATPREHDG